MFRDEAARFNGRDLDELYRERLLPDASHPHPPPPHTFHCEERLRGRRANVLQGLRLHAEVLSRSEQMQVLFFCRAMAELGRDGHLVGREHDLELQPVGQQHVVDAKPEGDGGGHGLEGELEKVRRLLARPRQRAQVEAELDDRDADREQQRAHHEARR